MNPFGLKSPCAKCPFRADIEPYLTRGRVLEIADGLRGYGTFWCHLTTDWGEDDDGEEAYQPTGREMHCAGALLLMEKEGRQSHPMQIAERIGLYDPAALRETSPVYPSFYWMARAQRR